MGTHRIRCSTALKQPHCSISAFNWIVLWDLSSFLQKKKKCLLSFEVLQQRTGQRKRSLNEGIQTLHSPTPTPSLTSTVQCCSQHALQKECWQGSASSESLLTTCRHTPQCSDWGAWKEEKKTMASNIATHQEGTKYCNIYCVQILLKRTQIGTNYGGWSAGAAGLHQSVWQQQRWVGLIPAGDGDRSQESIAGTETQLMSLARARKHHCEVGWEYLSSICLTCQWKCTRINFATAGKTWERTERVRAFSDFFAFPGWQNHEYAVNELRFALFLPAACATSTQCCL